MYISFAISSSVFSMLFIWSVMQSSGGVLKFLKTFLFIFRAYFIYSSIFRYVLFNTFFCILDGDFFSLYICDFS